MQVTLKDFLKEADITEAFYPGKRIVKPCKQTGEFKNHSVVLDWRNPDMIHIEIKAGLSGKQLAPEVLRKYPVCFQMPTYVNIMVTNDNDETEEDDDEEKGKSSGKGGSGGKKPAARKLEEIELISSRFGNSAEGSIPVLGKVTDMVVMGVALAKEAFGRAFSELARQVGHAKVSATEILAKASDMITRFEPPSFLKPKGDETGRYKYDREKNADIGMKPGFG